MNCPVAFVQTYLEEVLKILESACKLSTSTTAVKDEDLLKFLETLRETLVECYTTIVHGVK